MGTTGCWPWWRAFEARPGTKPRQRLIILIQADGDAGSLDAHLLGNLLAKHKLVMHCITRTVAGPEASGEITGGGAEDVAEGMPVQAPDNAVVGLLEGTHLLVPVSEPEEDGALGTATGKECLMHWMPGNR